MTAILNGVIASEYLTDRHSPGLGGVHDSVDYRVSEIERHLHSNERWMEMAGTPTATHFAVEVGHADGAGPWTLDAGDDDWGAWVQILGADDTPTDGAALYMDIHKIMVTAAERNLPYFFRFGYGASGAAALAAGTYTETVFVPASNVLDTGPLSIQTRRAAAGSLLWAQCMCPGQDTGTISLYPGGHEYEG